MGNEIWVALIAAFGSVAGVVITVVWGNKKTAAEFEKTTKRQTDLTLYRIDQLEEKVNKHNNLIERTYKLEQRLEVDEEKLKVANNRIHDLEEYHR